MRYAIFTDIHANLEALEAVLTKIDELGKQEPVDQIWFLGDLVGYGPNPNECIAKLREHTDVIIAGNHDWAAVGKIDLEEFSEAARISAQWTMEQLTDEHQDFLSNLPERLEIGECLLVHGSPYGPLWEYLTSEVLAERSFQYFANRFCLVGHTHVPIIFQQPDTLSNEPTHPLEDRKQENVEISFSEDDDDEASDTAAQNSTIDEDDDDEETVEMMAIRPTMQTTQQDEEASAFTTPLQNAVVDVADKLAEMQQHFADDAHGVEPAQIEATSTLEDMGKNNHQEPLVNEANEDTEDKVKAGTTSETTILNAEEQLNEEIEELLALLGLTQSMIRVTNEMIVPPEGTWHAPTGYRCIINPGGVGQPRDGDPRAAFMIYDTENGFTFYRIPYAIEKTQEKIIKAGLPQYLAKRLEYGR